MGPVWLTFGLTGVFGWDAGFAGAHSVGGTASIFDHFPFVFAFLTIPLFQHSQFLLSLGYWGVHREEIHDTSMEG